MMSQPRFKRNPARTIMTTVTTITHTVLTTTAMITLTVIIMQAIRTIMPMGIRSTRVR